MEIHKNTETDIYKFKNLSGYKEISHFVSSRILKTRHYDLNISLESGNAPETILNNRKILSGITNIPLENFVMQNQIHENNITVITGKDKGKGVYNHKTAIQNSDAMITAEPDICLFIFAADCAPVLFFDKTRKIIGAAHSGWKGTVKKIAKKTVLKMETVFDCKLENIIVGIAPHISVKNYEVGENVVNEVKNSFGNIPGLLDFNNKSGKYHFNLENAIIQQLKEAGIPENNIETSNFCTFENNDIFFSARKKDAGRFGAGIMLKY